MATLKKKTARIKGYHIFGTKNACAVDVLYRGRLLKGFEGLRSEESEMREKARAWAVTSGFTHISHQVN